MSNMMNKIKLLTILILGSVISCGDSMGMTELPTDREEAEDYCYEMFKSFPNTTAIFKGNFGGFGYTIGKLLDPEYCYQ